MRSSRCAWITCAALAALAACDGHGDHDDLAAAIATVSPHAPRFLSFEQWAARACSVADPRADARRLAETLFAPLRNDHRVVAAWVRLDAKAAGVISFPPASPLPNVPQWTDVRSPTLGWIRVASFDQCPLKGPDLRVEGESPPCVLVSRPDSKLAEQQPRVTMAFSVASPP